MNRNDFFTVCESKGAAWGEITHVIHMGACSATTERDFDYLYNNNFEYTKRLWNYCIKNNASFIYASSAATYGNGDRGFDDQSDINQLRPLNAYGYSKQLFDIWAMKQSIAPKQHAGFKFFNVYGPNEYYKGSMASVIFHAFNKITESGVMELFKSYQEAYVDGGQCRDFVYVKDLCAIIKHMMEHEEISGIYNVGTGRAETFHDLVSCTFDAMGIEKNIKYIEMPQHLKKNYQYYTKANIEKLRRVGYQKDFYTLEEGIKDYVRNYLMADYRTY